MSSRTTTALAALAGAVIGVIAGVRFSWFVWAEDRCLDMGGAIRAGACYGEWGTVPLDPWPPTLAAWTVTIVVAAVPAVVLFAMLQWIIGRFEHVRQYGRVR